MRYISSPNNFDRYKSFQKKRFFNLFQKKKKLAIKTETDIRYANPYKKSETNYRTKITVGLLVIILLAWIGLVIFLPQFRINKITFNGLQIIKQEEIEKEIRNKFLTGGIIVPKNNYFFVHSKKIEKTLSELFSLEWIKIKKEFPNTLMIDLKEKISAIIYDNGQEYAILSQTGEVIKKIGGVGEDEFKLAVPNKIIEPAISTSTFSTSTTSVAPSSTEMIRTHFPNWQKVNKEYPGYPIIYDEREIGVDSTPLDSDYIKQLINFYSRLNDRGDIQIKYMQIEHPLAGVKIYTNKNWYLLFQPKNNIVQQLENLDTLLKKGDSIGEYIDLRYEDKVFYK